MVGNMNIIQTHDDLLKVRFKRKPGQFIEHQDSIEMFSENGERCFIDFDDSDFTNYSWYSVNGYFYRRTSRKHPVEPNRMLYVHVLILERKIGRRLESGEFTDHIDWDKTNNRRVNLRVSSKSENAINSRGHKDRSGTYKGVARSANLYRVHLNYSVSISECGFASETEAARRYDELAAQHHGKHAVLNFPEDWVFDLQSKQYKKLNPE
jgi:hypothetical protein